MATYYRGMNTLILFAATVLIWGTSWFAIGLQVGEVPILVSIFYRFGLAATVMLTGLAVLGRLYRPTQWRFIFVQALCLFCFNFVGFYNAALLIPTGLISVVFSLASILNAINARIFFGEQFTLRAIIAGVIGASGLVLLFWKDLFIVPSADSLRGIAWAAGATMLFSLGNMASRRNSALGISPVIANAWGMGIGTIMLMGLILASGQKVILPQGGTYWAALIYLALIGSVVGFTVYLLLVARIGSAKAGYVTVAFPVVALQISNLFEGFLWTPTAVAGIALTILGNIVMFARRQ